MSDDQRELILKLAKAGSKLYRCPLLLTKNQGGKTSLVPCDAVKCGKATLVRRHLLGRKKEDGSLLGGTHGPFKGLFGVDCFDSVAEQLKVRARTVRSVKASDLQTIEAICRDNPRVRPVIDEAREAKRARDEAQEAFDAVTEKLQEAGIKLVFE